MQQKISLEQDALAIGRRELEVARDAIHLRVRLATTSAGEAAAQWRGSSATAAAGVVDDWAVEMKGLLALLDALGGQLHAAEVAQQLTELDANRTLGDLARLMGAR